MALPMTFECKSTVVKAPPHAQTCAVLVKGDQRRYHQIQPAGRVTVPIAANRFGDAETVETEAGILLPADKPQAVITERREHRQVKTLTGQPPVTQEAGVGFPPYRYVQGNMSGVAEYLLAVQSAGNPPGKLPLHPWREAGALLTDIMP